MPPKKKRGQSKQRGILTSAELPIRIDDIRLVDARSHQAIEKGTLPDNSRIRVQVKVGKDEADHTPHYIARPTVVFAAWYDKQQDGEPAILVEATFQLRYEFQEAPRAAQKKALEDLITKICMLHSWPYFREFMQSQINRMGLPPILLPLMAAPPLESKPAATRKSKKARPRKR